MHQYIKATMFCLILNQMVTVFDNVLGFSEFKLKLINGLLYPN